MALKLIFLFSCFIFVLTQPVEYDEYEDNYYYGCTDDDYDGYCNNNNDYDPGLDIEVESSLVDR